MRLAAVALMVLGLVTPASAALREGAVAPGFTAQGALGGRQFTFSLTEALGRGPVVLYFYPAAFTAGCTAEAHDFAEATERYAALGAVVVGVSGDDIATLDKFSVSACQSKFAVLADPHRAVMKAYDAVLIPLLSYADRVSYVIAPDGTVLYSYTALDPDEHVANTMKALVAWRAGHPLQRN